MSSKNIVFEEALRLYSETKPHRRRPSARECEKRYRFLLNLVPDTNANILDIGCGAGELINFFLSKGYQSVRGVDISETEINIAQERVGERAILSDANDFLKNCNQSFDLVCMFAVIEHFPIESAWELLKNIANHLNPEGYLVLRTLNCANPLSLYRRYNDITHRVGYTPESITQLLMLSGFEVVRICAGNELKRGIVAAAARALHGIYMLLFRFLLRSYGISQVPDTLHPDMIVIARKKGG